MTFFSGTDRSTLIEEGMAMPHFVSLIVNNAGKYTAKITRRVCLEAVKISYPTFNDGHKTEDAEANINEYIEAFPLDIEIEEDTTIKENTVAQDKKKATRKKKDTTAVVENTQPAEKVKASPIKKTINTERQKTFKEIVSTTDFEDTVSTSSVSEDKTEQESNKQANVVQDVPTHIGGVKLSNRLVNLLRRKASSK